MKSLNSYGIASPLGIQVVCVTLLFSFSPDASARTTTLPSAISPASFAAGPLDLTSSREQTRVPAPTVIRSTGAIEAQVEVFRTLLGGPNNGATAGQQPAGRREINWDAVPAALTNLTTFPNDFFNTNSKRGLVYEPTGSGLEVSDQSFTNINAEYDGDFIPFSGQKTFSPIGTNRTDVVFFVAGSTTKAAVRGIGVVFADVDKIGGTTIELLGQNGLKLGKFTAPIRSDRRGASFLGIVFRDPVITQVHIVTGDGRLAANEIDISNGGQNDLVVMDDFIYGEPTAIAP